MIKDPILKVVGYKNVPGANPGQNRYRLLITDGVKSHSCKQYGDYYFLSCYARNSVKLYDRKW